MKLTEQLGERTDRSCKKGTSDCRERGNNNILRPPWEPGLSLVPAAAPVRPCPRSLPSPSTKWDPRVHERVFLIYSRWELGNGPLVNSNFKATFLQTIFNNSLHFISVALAFPIPTSLFIPFSTPSFFFFNSFTMDFRTFICFIALLVISRAAPFNRSRIDTEQVIQPPFPIAIGLAYVSS